MTGLAGGVACYVVYIRMPGCGEHECLPFHATVTNGGRNHPYVCERLVLVAQWHWNGFWSCGACFGGVARVYYVYMLLSQYFSQYFSVF